MNLVELRESRGLTQQQVADAAGMSQQRLSEYERGVRPVSNMTLAQAVRLADALKIRNPRKLLEP
ncbi:helix-turn-helix domain-containing protein [Bifidobacterium castoris]|uniref:PbsX family transcriptional regulator n=1 Tax=Bifidobacterium castoris TaxID=2306972 RepID=A0A430F5H6_9BIFI|nr:helix-turn-helix transcriptional regulator [Bifidobacterium castoris]MDE5641501.1 helix-turn-helix transcriptional regulator [Bifidobacterium castoris]RSX46135.1 PbsX family transcriptional regulator [Bifidobacterium castoris]